jgi:hypothetical protein
MPTKYAIPDQIMKSPRRSMKYSFSQFHIRKLGQRVFSRWDHRLVGCGKREGSQRHQALRLDSWDHDQVEYLFGVASGQVKDCAAELEIAET